PLAVLARLPDVKDAEDAGVEVEAGRVNQQSFGGALEVECGADSVVVGGARVAILDLELLNVCDRHFSTPLSSGRLRSYSSWVGAAGPGEMPLGCASVLSQNPEPPLLRGAEVGV